MFQTLPFKSSKIKNTPMATVNEVLSPALRVKPLEKGQIAIYRLIEADKDDPAVEDIKGNPRKRTPGYTIAGRKKVFDPIAAKTVEIENKTTVVRTRTPLGDIEKSRPEPVRFTSQRPAIQVRHEDPELYAFLERINENADNPFRTGKVAPIFYRVDPRKKVMKENELRELKLSALNWVYKEASYTDLKVCAEYVKKVRNGVSIRTDYTDAEASMGYELLKRELSALADTDPDLIIKGCSNVLLKIQIQVKDCKRFSIILFNDSDRTWFFNDVELTSICTVEPMKNPEEALINFIAKDKNGGKHYTKMCDLLDAFLTPR